MERIFSGSRASSFRAHSPVVQTWVLATKFEAQEAADKSKAWNRVDKREVPGAIIATFLQVHPPASLKARYPSMAASKGQGHVHIVWARRHLLLTVVLSADPAFYPQPHPTPEDHWALSKGSPCCLSGGC